MIPSLEIEERLKHIRLLLLDVDGVMTDGSLYFDDTGEEAKFFNSKDGLGISLLMKEGVGVGIVTGRSSDALLHRCRNLRIELVYQGIRDKLSVLPKITEKTKVSPMEMAFVGDDLLDLPMMLTVGVGIAVADAHEEVLKRADIVTVKNGGKGAVREVCDAILKARGAWENIVKSFIPQPEQSFGAKNKEEKT